ncbi:TetR/AcrR family transcriptional regulator [Advenella incenata]
MKTTTQTPNAAGGKRRSYHHGNLTEALIDASIKLIEKDGVEKLSMRQAAKLAGVSPGAPFRHFSSKTALLTAVAEQAMQRLSSAIAKELANVDSESPLNRFHAIGLGYLNWALAHPTHFQIISSRTLIDFETSEYLVKENKAIREHMVVLLQQAQRLNEISPAVHLDHLILSARALVYGLARMAIDGHMPEWHPNEPSANAVERALDQFIESIRTRK